MTTRTIKDVDERTWRKIRILSAEHNIRMGKLIEKMTDEYEKSSKSFWKAVLNGEKILSDKEAMEMKKAAAEFRKERGFR